MVGVGYLWSDLFDEVGVEQVFDFWCCFDDVDFEQQIGGFFVEGQEVVGEEFLVGGFVLLVQVFC